MKTDTVRPGRKTGPSNKVPTASELLDRAFPPSAADIAFREKVGVDNTVAQQIHDLRRKAGLTQKQLADRIGTTQSVISELEDADYQGHSMAMLHRIAEALHNRVEIRFVPARRKLQSA